MKKSTFTEEQIAFTLMQAESGTSVEEVRRKMRISHLLRLAQEAWRPGVSELRRLRQIEGKRAVTSPVQKW